MRTISILFGLLLCLTQAAEAQSLRQQLAELTTSGGSEKFTPKDRNRTLVQTGVCRDRRPAGATAPLCIGHCREGRLCDIQGNGCACQ